MRVSYQRSFLRGASLSACLLIPALCALAAETATAPQEAKQAQAQAVAITPIVQAALNAGVQACLGRIHQVSQFIGSGNQVGAFFFAPPAQPDQHLVSFSYEIRPANGPLAYASANFAPNQANGCGAEYEAIVYWPKKCKVVAAKQFAELKKGPALQKEIMVLGSASTTRIFLMPAGSGCVSIKKEVIL